MPFTLLFDPKSGVDGAKGGIHMPSAICDACDQPIKDANRAKWVKVNDEQPEAPVLLAHDEVCYRDLKARLKGASHSVGTLRSYLIRLAYNSGAITEEEATRLISS